MYKATSHHLVLCFSALILFSQVQSFHFNENGEFTVLQFTDFHYGEDESKDLMTQELQRRLLALIKPDLAIVSGDGVSGYAGHHFFGLLKTYGFFKENWAKFTLPFKEANIPYAFLIGNHDDGADFNKQEIIELEKTNPLSVLGMSEEVSHTTTYSIPIYSSKNSKQLSANIWMFDTGNIGCEGVPDTWGCIDENQVEWYNEKSKKLTDQYGKNVNHIAFFHIAIPEFLKARNENEISGYAGEYVSCPLISTSFFDHVKKNGDITAMFVGHDHDNDWEGSYRGVELVYGRKSGYGAYGKHHGARIIKFKETINSNGDTIVERNHYIIDENGNVVINEIIPPQEIIQNGCIPEKENPIVLIKESGIFEYLQIGVMVTATFTLCLKIFRRIMGSENQAKINTKIHYKGNFVKFEEEEDGSDSTEDPLPEF